MSASTPTLKPRRRADDEACADRIGSNPSYRRRIALDISYARNKCLALDLRILAMMLPAALFVWGD